MSFISYFLTYFLSNFSLIYRYGPILLHLLPSQLLLITSNIHNNKTVYHFHSTLPLPASSIGFVAGVFRKKQISPTSSVCAVVDTTHQYMVDYCVEVVKKAATYLGTVFSHECVERVKLLKSTSFVFVNEPPEPYSVTKNLVILDRDLLIGEKVLIQ